MAAQSIEYVPIDSIICPPQVREHFDAESLMGMTQSVKEVGVQQPIQLRRVGGKLLLTDGARRLAAARKAGLTTIPAIIEEREFSDADVVQRQFILNCQREDLTPLEKAKALDRLIKETGWSASQVASKLGMSNAAMTRLLALLTLPDAIRKQVEKGEVSASAAYELTRVQDATQQSALADQVASGELTRDALSGAVKAKKKSGGRKSSALSRVTAKLGAGRSVTVAAASLSLESFIEILEELLTRARQARPKGLSLATFLKVLSDQSKT